MTRILRSLVVRDRLLGSAALAFAAGFVLAGVASLFDTRLITGINAWIKPMKFAISIAVFLGTVAWFMPEMTRRLRLRTWLRWTLVVAMVIEILAIGGQAARGTTSHFNQSTAFDAIVFGVMGAAITINTLAAGALLLCLRSDTAPQRSGYLWGIRLGLVVFVIGSFLGFVLVTNHGHAVPGPDGGPGWPFLNWSYDRGDLRIAHFIGLHALQGLPLLGWILDARITAPSHRRLSVSAVALTWLLVAATTLLTALRGQPPF